MCRHAARFLWLRLLLWPLQGIRLLSELAEEILDFGEQCHGFLPFEKTLIGIPLSPGGFQLDCSGPMVN